MMWLMSGNEIDITKFTQVKAFAIDPSIPIYGGILESPILIGEYFPKEVWDKMPKITKEEFYNALPK